MIAEYSDKTPHPDPLSHWGLPLPISQVAGYRGWRPIVRGTGFSPHSPFPSPQRQQSGVSHAGLACGGEGWPVWPRNPGRRS
jgi:hypothetical protein